MLTVNFTLTVMKHRRFSVLFLLLLLLLVLFRFLEIFQEPLHLLDVMLF